MVCHGPDPPDDSPHELNPPPRHELLNGHQAEDSDDEQEHFGYEPLPQAPDNVQSDRDSSDDEVEGINASVRQAPVDNMPPIEPMEMALSREVWNAPRPVDPIQMDNERAQQVMSAMANFALPAAAIPEWAQSISEEQWKQTLNDRLEKMKGNR